MKRASSSESLLAVFSLADAALMLCSLLGVVEFRSFSDNESAASGHRTIRKKNNIMPGQTK